MPVTAVSPRRLVDLIVLLLGLQEQLDFEDASHPVARSTAEAPSSAAEELRQSLFSFAAPQNEAGLARGGRRGRGRGRSRGGGRRPRGGP